MTGTKYSFIVEIEFGRPYIGKFDIVVGMDPLITSRYFSGIPVRTLR